jgi:hypothetical protein
LLTSDKRSPGTKPHSRKIPPSKLGVLNKKETNPSPDGSPHHGIPYQLRDGKEALAAAPTTRRVDLSRWLACLGGRMLDAGGFCRAGTGDEEDDERTVIEPDLLHGGFTKLEIEHSAS